MSTKVLMTVADLEQTPRPDEGGGYELDKGELVHVSPNSLEQSDLIFRIQSLLRRFVNERSLGRVTGDAWFHLLPKVVRAPDVAFIPADRLQGLDPKHALKALPSLVIEILGPSQPVHDLTRRIQQYRDAGVEAVWVVDPHRREVEVYGAGPAKTLTLDDTLTAPGILPGFSLPVSQLFESDPLG